MIGFLLAVSAAYILAAAVFFPVLPWRSAAATGWKVIVAAAVLACPLLIPSDQIMGRAFASLVCVDLFFRLMDLSRQVRQAGTGPATWRDFAWFLIPFPALLVLYGAKERASLPKGSDGVAALVRTVASGVLFMGMLALTLTVRQSSILRESFWLDHTVKVAIFAAAIESLSQTLCGPGATGGIQDTADRRLGDPLANAGRVLVALQQSSTRLALP